MEDRPVFIAGASGFVGAALADRLVAGGVRVLCGSRHPLRAARRRPERDWIRLDVGDLRSCREAFAGCGVLYYLVHRMEPGADYVAEERAAARTVATAAAEAGLDRVVYLGGVEPRGAPSRHLQSRLETGRILREGRVPAVELRASMVVGAGSQSWGIVRDLAARLPLMVLPRWMENRSRPVALEDVLFALEESRGPGVPAPGVYDVPGPDLLSSREILEHIARIRGTRPVMLGVPLVSPRLSAEWIRWVTRADVHLARELVAGLTADLSGSEPGFYAMFPEHHRTSFDEAARRALAREPREPSVRARAWEETARRLSRRERR